MSDGYKSATEWKQGISAALGVMPGGWNYSLDGAVEKIEDLMRDSAARERERARAANPSLPEPDATNPEHCKWAAQLLEAIVEDVPESEYEQVREVDNTADRLRWRADRLDAARSAEREREQRIEEAAEIVCDASAVLSGEATWNKAPDWWKDTFREAARALDAAGLLRGGGRGE